MLEVKEFFDDQTYTLSYIVFDSKTYDCIVIDPVWDYDQASSSVSTKSVDVLMDFINDHKLTLHSILETHAHADHLSGAILLKKRFPKAKLAIGKNITKVQKSFKEIFNFKDFNTSGVQFDILLEEEQIFKAGSIEVKAIFTPGHTPACCTYLIKDMAFTGDALFMPDFGTGRCDFPMGSAKDLYDSVMNKIYQLPEDTLVYTGHDYLPGGRKLKFQSTIKEQKLKNIHLNINTKEEDFIHFRNKRDKTLSTPKLLFPSIQVNIDGGKLPKAEKNDVSYLKVPIRTKDNE